MQIICYWTNRTKRMWRVRGPEGSYCRCEKLDTMSLQNLMKAIPFYFIGYGENGITRPQSWSRGHTDTTNRNSWWWELCFGNKLNDAKFHLDGQDVVWFDLQESVAWSETDFNLTSPILKNNFVQSLGPSGQLNSSPISFKIFNFKVFIKVRHSFADAWN